MGRLSRKLWLRKLWLALSVAMMTVIVLPGKAYGQQRPRTFHPTETASAPPTDATSTTTRDWACIRWHESRDNYRAISPDGQYTGAYQIANYVWTRLLHRAGEAWQALPTMQDVAALQLWHWSLRVWGDGWHPWSTAPLCGLY